MCGICGHAGSLGSVCVCVCVYAHAGSLGSVGVCLCMHTLDPWVVCVCVCVCVCMCTLDPWVMCVCVYTCVCEKPGRLVHGVTELDTAHTHMYQYTNNVYILINYFPKGI